MTDRPHALARKRAAFQHDDDSPCSRLPIAALPADRAANPHLQDLPEALKYGLLGNIR